MRTSRFHVAESGTRYVKNPEPKPPVRQQIEKPSKSLMPLLNGEASGDFELAVIMALRNHLNREGCWTHKGRARNKFGIETDPTSRDAVKWTIFGALEYVLDGMWNREQRLVIIERIKTCIPKDDPNRLTLFRWEEEATYKQVIWLLNMAVASRKSELGYLR